MKNNIIHALLAAGITFGWWLIIYFMFAFVQWDFNPAIWTKETRAFYGFIGGFFGLIIGIGILISLLIEESDKTSNK